MVDRAQHPQGGVCKIGGCPMFQLFARFFFIY